MTNPEEIAQTSFRIIDREVGENKPEEKLRPVIYRVIHTTADFDYLDLMEFSGNPIEAFREVIKKPFQIYIDTRMAIAGINEKKLSELGGKIINFSHDPDVIKEAQEKNLTRSMLGIKKALTEPVDIYVIGNAPTALRYLIDHCKEADPKLIIGVPVGFVGAAEAKKELDKTGVPFIRTNGPKGGSTVATAIVNALLNNE